MRRPLPKISKASYNMGFDFRLAPCGRIININPVIFSTAVRNNNTGILAPEDLRFADVYATTY
jgi:hypothetical protein